MKRNPVKYLSAFAAAVCALSLLCLAVGATAFGNLKPTALEQAENQAEILPGSEQQTTTTAPTTEDRTTGSVVAVVIAVLVVIAVIALIIIFVPKAKRAG